MMSSSASPMNRYSQLSPIPPGPKHGSASLSEANREIEKLKEENSQLKREIDETRSLYNQLIAESTRESSDLRRVQLLKAQVIQLERQVLLLSDALSSRAGILLEVENNLSSISDTCRVANPYLTPSDVQKVVETCEYARLKLFKAVEVMSPEHLAKPLLFLGSFVKPSPAEPPTLLDVCSGSLEHVNLKQVGKLESKLSQLYGDLRGLCTCLEGVLSTPSNGQLSPTLSLPNAALKRLNSRSIAVQKNLRECCDNLLELSLLMPTAPWPALAKSRPQSVTAQSALARLPWLPRARRDEVKRLIQSVIRATGYQVHMCSVELKAVQSELQYLQSLQQVQGKFLHDFSQAMIIGYKDFEQNVNSVLCQPLAEILKRFEGLRSDMTEEALKQFLVVLRDYEPMLNDAVKSLKMNSDSATVTGSRALSEFGARFFDKLQTLVHNREVERERDVLEIERVAASRNSASQEAAQWASAPNTSTDKTKSMAVNDKALCHSPTRCIGDTSEEPSTVSEAEDASPTSLKPVAGSELSFIFPAGNEQGDDTVGPIFPLQQQSSKSSPEHRGSNIKLKSDTKSTLQSLFGGKPDAEVDDPWRSSGLHNKTEAQDSNCSMFSCHSSPSYNERMYKGQSGDSDTIPPFHSSAQGSVPRVRKKRSVLSRFSVSQSEANDDKM